MKLLSYAIFLGLLLIRAEQLQASWLPNLTTILRQGSHISAVGPISFFVGLSAIALTYSTLPKSWREKITETIPTQTLRNVAKSDLAQKIRKYTGCVAGPFLGIMLMRDDWMRNNVMEQLSQAIS